MRWTQSPAASALRALARLTPPPSILGPLGLAAHFSPPLWQKAFCALGVYNIWDIALLRWLFLPSLPPPSWNQCPDHVKEQFSYQISALAGTFTWFYFRLFAKFTWYKEERGGEGLVLNPRLKKNRDLQLVNWNRIVSDLYMLSDNFGRGYIQLYIYIYINLPYDNISLL